MPTFLSRLLDVVLRRSRDRVLAEEVQAHLDLLTDEYVAGGMTPEGARLAARLRPIARRAARLDPIAALRQD